MTNREKTLIEEGWERRLIACEPKLSEIVELYREIGFDVHLEPLPQKNELKDNLCESEECTACYDLDREKYMIIYTRPRNR